MFNTHKDRGRVLLAVRVHSAGWMLFLWVMVSAWVGLLALFLLKPNGLGRFLRVLPHLTASLAAISGYVLYPRIKFYEGGVEIPPARDYNRVRYLRCDQVEHSSWDGDRLVLTGTNSVPAGGYDADRGRRVIADGGCLLLPLPAAPHAMGTASVAVLHPVH
jgi:hypothetical protein